MSCIFSMPEILKLKGKYYQFLCTKVLYLKDIRQGKIFPTCNLSILKGHVLVLLSLTLLNVWLDTVLARDKFLKIRNTQEIRSIVTDRYGSLYKRGKIHCRVLHRQCCVTGFKILYISNVFFGIFPPISQLPSFYR